MHRKMRFHNTRLSFVSQLYSVDLRNRDPQNLLTENFAPSSDGSSVSSRTAPVFEAPLRGEGCDLTFGSELRLVAYFVRCKQ